MKSNSNTNTNTTTNTTTTTVRTTPPSTGDDSISMNAPATNTAESPSSNTTVPSLANMAGNIASNAAFSDEVNGVTNQFEKWNDCERMVVMYALLKRLSYPSLKLLQYSIDNNLVHNPISKLNLSTVVTEMNANNTTYLQDLLNTYKNSQLGDLLDTVSSSSSSDKDSIPCYGSDFQLTHCDERKLYSKKESVLQEVLSFLPLLKPGNDDAKLIYLTLMPLAVKDTMRQIVPTEVVQQIFSYLWIHPAFSGDDRRSLNIWLRHLEDYIHTTTASSSGISSSSSSSQPLQHSFFLPSQTVGGNISSLITEHSKMTTSASSTCSVSTNSSCSAVSSAAANESLAPTTMGGTTLGIVVPSCCGGRSSDWQTIAPPNKQQAQQKHQHKAATTSLHDWSSASGNSSGSGSISGSGSCNSSGNSAGSGGIANQLCDNLNGIKLNELASSQNSLGLSLGAPLMDHACTSDAESSTLVNGLAAAAVSAAPGLFGGNTNPIINILNNNNDNCSSNLNGADDHDTSFSKNGIEILDFEPNPTATACDTCSSNNNNNSNGNGNSNFCIMQQPQMPFASMLMSNCDQLDINRWSLDSKLAALKTRRSNSLTTQTISSSASSSNSSVITVNDNCSNSTENLAQFANKPRSFSLSIEHQRGVLTNSGSDTRLDDFKPNYIKFHTRNVGMSSIGLWLKSLRLHKYIDLFKNMTYEEMLQITEEYLQSLGVTKGASHKLALCIEKLKERPLNLVKLEQELMSGQLKIQQAVEELANIVLTPMKPVEVVNVSAGEENVALLFLQVVDLVCSIVQKDPCAAQDEESVSVIMWILERAIHNEAFVGHVNQLKELKFKFSKMKMAIAPRLHHVKTGSGGNINKPRWNSKSRKSDPKSGSNDRINHRKNSNDMLNFSPLSCVQQQQQQQQHHSPNQSDFSHHNSSGASTTSNCSHRSSFPNFGNNPTHHTMKQIHTQQQQQLQQHQMLQHSFPGLSQQKHQHQLPHQQHRRSLNNLIMVTGGPQQAQKIIFKPGQGILSAAGAAATTASVSADNIQVEQALKHQQRKASLPALNNTSTSTSNSLLATFAPIGIGNSSNPTETTNTDNITHQPPKKTLASMVMVSSNDELAVAVGNNLLATSAQQALPQILINNNNNSSTVLNNNLMCQQQQQQQQHLLQQQQQEQQLQLLAVAAAAVGSSCKLNQSQHAASCLCTTNNNSKCSNSNNNNSNNNNNNNTICCHNQSNSVCINNCNNLAAVGYENTAAHNATIKRSYPLANSLNDIRSLEQLETLCLQMTEQAIN